jgi:hypothetical protein
MHRDINLALSKSRDPIGYRRTNDAGRSPPRRRAHSSARQATLVSDVYHEFETNPKRMLVVRLDSDLVVYRNIYAYADFRPSSRAYSIQAQRSCHPLNSVSGFSAHATLTPNIANVFAPLSRTAWSVSQSLKKCGIIYSAGFLPGTLRERRFVVAE